MRPCVPVWPSWSTEGSSVSGASSTSRTSEFTFEHSPPSSSHPFHFLPLSSPHSLPFISSLLLLLLHSCSLLFPPSFSSFSLHSSRPGTVLDSHCRPKCSSHPLQSQIHRRVSFHPVPYSRYVVKQVAKKAPRSPRSIVPLLYRGPSHLLLLPPAVDTSDKYQAVKCSPLTPLMPLLCTTLSGRCFPEPCCLKNTRYLYI